MNRRSIEMWKALAGHTQSTDGWALTELVLRLAMEVEALRSALTDPRVPAEVRIAYREAYASTALLSHDATGPTGGSEKVLRKYFPHEPQDGTEREDIAGELAMLARLGADEVARSAHAAMAEEAEQYT
ncbi:MAG TPA: hypothetical protein VM925_20850 [Labilithrix sp.]|jgi:hypothetical protein|nr:hypothetical protein [Labilithrix sp.]